MEREKMKKEAIERIKILDFESDLEIDERFEAGELYFSDRTRLGGSNLVPISSLPELAEKIKEIEEAQDILVYHATHESTDFGEMFTLFYVSDSEEEWNLDKKDLSFRDRDGMFIFMAYVLNITYPDLSEFGSVAMKKTRSGLIRVG